MTSTNSNRYVTVGTKKCAAGFAWDIVRINSRTSADTVGRPVRCRLFHVQNRKGVTECRDAPRDWR